MTCVYLPKNIKYLISTKIELYLFLFLVVKLLYHLKLRKNPLGEFLDGYLKKESDYFCEDFYERLMYKYFVSW